MFIEEVALSGFLFVFLLACFVVWYDNKCM